MIFIYFKVAHMSKSALNSWDTAYIGPLAICINQYFNIWISEHILMWIFLVNNFCFFFFIKSEKIDDNVFFQLFGLYDLLRYNVKVCQELCGSLNISCFRIEPSDGPVSNINQWTFLLLFYYVCRNLSVSFVLVLCFQCCFTMNRCFSFLRPTLFWRSSSYRRNLLDVGFECFFLHFLSHSNIHFDDMQSSSWKDFLVGWS